jgi:hypothetical protein
MVSPSAARVRPGSCCCDSYDALALTAGADHGRVPEHRYFVFNDLSHYSFDTESNDYIYTTAPFRYLPNYKQQT